MVLLTLTLITKQSSYYFDALLSLQILQCNMFCHKLYLVNIFTCAPAMLRTGIVFGGVCLSVCVSVCPHKISKTTDQKFTVTW